MLLVLVLGGGASAPLHAAPGTILVVGDSLSAGYGIDPAQGWVSLLANKVDGRYKVVNASISGDTTSGGLTRLPRALQIHGPDVVVLELGGNDGLRGTSIRQMRANLDQMIRLAKEADAKVVLLGMQIPPNLGPAYTRAFADVFPALASEHNLPIVPFFLEGVAGYPEFMQDDGIHPRSNAQPTMLNNVWAVLGPMLGPMLGADQ
ncbi:MAG: arylesterase [Pseudomonadota bacterium]